MFHWICPECGREIPPAVKECAVCDPQVSATPAANSALSESSKPLVNPPSNPAEAIAPTAAAAPASIEVPKEPLPEPPEPPVAEALASPETLVAEAELIRAAVMPSELSASMAAEIPKEEAEPRLIPDPVLLREIGAWLEHETPV